VGNNERTPLGFTMGNSGRTPVGSYEVGNSERAPQGLKWETAVGHHKVNI